MILSLNNDFLAVVDVDARNAWHAVELHALEVVPSVILLVGNYSFDSTWVFLGNMKNIQIGFRQIQSNNLKLVGSSLLDAEVCTVKESDISFTSGHFVGNQEVANAIFVLATKPSPVVAVWNDNLELCISLQFYATSGENAISILKCDAATLFGLVPTVECANQVGLGNVFQRILARYCELVGLEEVAREVLID